MGSIQERFYQNFIQDDRWRYLWDGLYVTLEVTLLATLIGILLGFIVAIIRSTHDRTGKFRILNALCQVYLTVIRGTPVVVQLLIIGFSYAQTMWYIVLPQAFKNVLPALGNEFIVLLKETSISGYIALQDLTKGGDIIRSRTYDAFMPLVGVALVYLALVLGFSKLVSMLERRLNQSER